MSAFGIGFLYLGFIIFLYGFLLIGLEWICEAEKKKSKRRRL
jgi:hypothetical protein